MYTPKRLNDTFIERRCALDFPALNPNQSASLRGWKENIVQRFTHAIDRLTDMDPRTDWATYVTTHPAANHLFYEQMADLADGDTFAAFLAEEAYMPAFIPLLQLTLTLDLPSISSTAILRNLSEEFQPKRHSVLFTELLEHALSKWTGEARNDGFLSRTNLVYLFGAVDPLFLIGALYPTEIMVPHRVTLLKAGLKRLGVRECDMAFLTVHAECDHRHGVEWLEQVIVPLSSSHEAKRKMAEGIVLRLETSREYLNNRLSMFGLGDNREIG
jgi:hypothetical protein